MSAREIAAENMRRWEKCALFVYDDGYFPPKPVVPGHTMKGHPTVGWGRALDTCGVTQLEADRMMELDLDRAQAAASGFTWFHKLNEVRQAVIMVMCENEGPGGVAQFKDMIAAIEAGDFAMAAACMVDSKWEKQVGARAHELAGMMAHG